MHTNMLTVNGVRMSKSAGNGFLPGELFTGAHPLLEKGYAPMVVRFFMMQTHYRSTLDFSNEALKASEKGFERLINAIKLLPTLPTSSNSSFNFEALRQSCYDAMNDDFNSPILIARLFDGVRIINSIKAGTETITAADLQAITAHYFEFVFNVLGLKFDDPLASNSDNDALGAKLMDVILEIRKEVRAKKDFITSDFIRDQLKKVNITIKDTKDGPVWESQK